MPAPSSALKLDGRNVLITGAAGGIGRAIVAAFAECGAACTAFDLRAGDGMLACDVGDEAAVRAAFDAAERRGKVTDVVHAAGIVTVGCGGRPAARRSCRACCASTSSAAS